MSWQAWLGWLAWGVFVFFFMLWYQGRREAQQRETQDAPPTSRRRLLRRRATDRHAPAPPAEPAPAPPAATFEGWVDAYNPTSTGAPPTPPWADEPPPAPAAHAHPSLVAEHRTAIAAAIARGAAIRFEYTDREGGRSTRTIEPRALQHVALAGQPGQHECVLGHCRQRGAERAFLLARIHGLQVLEGPAA